MSVFSSLIDQSQVVEILKDAAQAAHNSNDLSQAMTNTWLFTGPPGSGRSNTAIAFAAALVCKEGGCSKCNDCLSTILGAHPDVELFTTDGLSIKVGEIRDLISRSTWAPSMSNYRIVVIEDADRLTESAANALLKVIEEPGIRTVWLLCAPNLLDLLPTIRSRCRNLALKSPSTKSIAKLLIEKEGISKELAEFAARVSQGHVGIAKHLATSQEARDSRQATLKLPLMIKNISTAYNAAETLVNHAKMQVESDLQTRNELELVNLKQAWGSTGSKLVTGGAKVIKELEKEQKIRNNRLVRDYLDRALLDLATFYRDVLLFQFNLKTLVINIENLDAITKCANSITISKSFNILQSIFATRDNLARNAAPLMALEALMCKIK